MGIMVYSLLWLINAGFISSTVLSGALIFGSLHMSFAFWARRRHSDP